MTPLKPLHREGNGDPLLALFQGIFELLKLHIGEAAGKMELKLSAQFEQELMYVLLYLFSTLLFMNARREDAAVPADHLAKSVLTDMSRLQGARVGSLVEEYRSRYDYFRRIRLFASAERVLMDEWALSLGRQFVDGSGRGAQFLFGTVASGLIMAPVGSLRQELASLKL